MLWIKKCVFNFFTFFCQGNFMDWHSNFTTNLRPHFQNSFSQHFICFLFKAQNCLEIFVNCAWNCEMPLFTPLEVQFSKIIFFKNVLKVPLWIFYMQPKRDKNMVEKQLKNITPFLNFYLGAVTWFASMAYIGGQKLRGTKPFFGILVKLFHWIGPNANSV